MTGQPRATCCVCFAAFPDDGSRKCPACDPARVVRNNTPTKRAAPKLHLAALPTPSEDDLTRYLATMDDQ